MARSFIHRYRRPAGEVSFNITPLIDCTFLMILFVILGGQIVSGSSPPKVDLPKPHRSQAAAIDAGKPNKVIVNVLSAAGEKGSEAQADLATQASGYRIDGKTIALGDNETLAGIFKARQAATGGEIFIEIRADQRVQFGQVQPVLAAATDAGVSRANISALLDGEK
ncbi:MAG: biopolymer transporter ExbD [Phycisphaerae bacterium]